VRGRAAFVATVLASVVAFVGAAPLRAQGAPAGDRVIEGRVVRPGPSAPIPVQDVWVVLHRVGADAAGPLDSVRTRADGGFRFRYRASGDTSAVYFVSNYRGGVAYFTAPLRRAVVRGDDAELLVYDTTSAPVRITVRGRHIIVPAPDSAGSDRRTVIEVYELSNDSSVTRVARGRDGATFDAALPDGVDTVTGGQGDVSPAALAVVEGRLRVNAPLAPGIKQLSFFYEVPLVAFPLAYPLDTEVPVLEVLVEDPNGTATGGGLADLGPTDLQGRTFRRFLASNAPAGAVVRITSPGAGAGSSRVLRLMLIATAVGAAMLLGLGMAFMRKGPAALARRRDVDPESLALAIAALDAEFEKLAQPTEAQRAQHYVARAQLKGRLSAALAKRDGLG
jgi:hypothetical protein